MIDKNIKFRFQDLEIWKMAIDIGDKLFKIAHHLDEKRLYRFAEQLRAAGLSMSNNMKILYAETFFEDYNIEKDINAYFIDFRD